MEYELDNIPDSSFTAYSERIGSYPLLTSEDEIKLSKIIRSSPNEARRDEAIRKLVLGNLRLVLFCLKGIREGSSLTKMDLIQEGNLALMAAASTYDYKKYGTRFATYAATSIRHKLTSATVNDRMISAPNHHKSYIPSLLKIQRMMGYESIADVTFHDFQRQDWIPAEMRRKMTRTLLERVKQSQGAKVTSIEALGGDGDFDIVDDSIPPGMDLSEKREYLQKTISDVANPGEASIIKMLFYDGIPLMKVQEILGISKQAINVRLRKLIIKLRRRIVRDKKDFDCIPEKWRRLMNGSIKVSYARSKTPCTRGIFEPVFDGDKPANKMAKRTRMRIFG